MGKPGAATYDRTGWRQHDAAAAACRWMAGGGGMRTARLGRFGEVSRLALGGGGIGGVRGRTGRAEALATVRGAVAGGITLIDTAPVCRHCERVIGEAWNGRVPEGVRITSKVRLGTPPAGQVARRVQAAAEATLAAMKPG